MRPKYLLVGDYVISQRDGDRHYISAEKLRRLYDLGRADCVLAEGDLAASLIQRARPELVTLRPRSDGNYTLPEEAAHD